MLESQAKAANRESGTWVATDRDFVKIHLQRREPRLYYKGSGQWTKARGEAWAFKSSSDALDFCEQENIRDAEIVLAFEEERYDIRFGAFRHNRVEKR